MITLFFDSFPEGRPSSAFSPASWTKPPRCPSAGTRPLRCNRGARSPGSVSGPGGEPAGGWSSDYSWKQARTRRAQTRDRIGSGGLVEVGCWRIRGLAHLWSRLESQADPGFSGLFQELTPGPSSSQMKWPCNHWCHRFFPRAFWDALCNLSPCVRFLRPVLPSGLHVHVPEEKAGPRRLEGQST